MQTLKDFMDRYCELTWWNMGTKTKQYEGDLKGLLKNQGITFRKYKTENKAIFRFIFKSQHGLTFEKIGLLHDIPMIAKTFVQMEMVRMGDPSQLYVQGTWRPTVTVNR